MTDPGVTDLPKAHQIKMTSTGTDCGPQLVATTLGPGSGSSLRRTGGRENSGLGQRPQSQPSSATVSDLEQLSCFGVLTKGSSGQKVSLT